PGLAQALPTFLPAEPRPDPWENQDPPRPRPTPLPEAARCATPPRCATARITPHGSSMQTGPQHNPATAPRTLVPAILPAAPALHAAHLPPRLRDGSPARYALERRHGSG